MGSQTRITDHAKIPGFRKTSLLMEQGSLKCRKLGPLATGNVIVRPNLGPQRPHEAPILSGSKAQIQRGFQKSWLVGFGGSLVSTGPEGP